MLSSKTIRNKIFSTKNTNKITRTMEMISISKMKKIKKKISNSIPYQIYSKNIINNLMSSSLEFKHLYLTNNKKINKICIIIISTDKGLCGSLNTNLFRKILIEIKKYKDSFINLIVMGKKGINFFKNYYSNFIIDSFNFSKFSFFDSSLKILKTVKYLYENKKIQKVFLASNKSKNSVIFKPKIFQLLPINNEFENKNFDRKFLWSYIYEPYNTVSLSILFKKYLESTIYCRILENLYCEHASRFFSMKHASENSENIIKNLKLTYNKCRQSNVTKELIEIVSGCSSIL
ncbi:MAG: F0F1 ATP synthase subunit gamma [Buchnera aphidicola (Ceratovacuna japonica)]